MPIRFFKKRLSLCFLIIGCFIASSTCAGELASSSTVTQKGAGQTQSRLTGAHVQLNADYFTGYGTDFSAIVTSPARWNASDWITATVITGITAGLYENDAKIQKWVLAHRTATTGTIGDKVTLVGHGALTPVVLGGMYLYGRAADDAKIQKTVLLSVESFVITGVFVQTLKYTAHRHRPDTNDPAHTLDGASLKRSSSTMSFPSGHASSAFAVATVIAGEYDNAVIPPIAYTIAAITSLNRVSHNAHWSSDAFVGSAIGYFTGKAIVAAHRNTRENTFSLAPLLLESGAGIVLTCQF